MKNQYFGDVNDYRKYGMLRALQSGSRLPLAVCWMLTPDDGGPDGRHVAYLSNPKRWRRYDPEVFDRLQSALYEGTRSIEIAGRSFLSSAVTHPDLLSHESAARERYLADLRARVASPSLVFFDPDNGLEVKSMPAGRRGAEKFLYWSELGDVYRDGHSCLIYQHWPRENRDRYSRSRARQTTAHLAAPWTATLRTSHVLFLLAPQAAHARSLEAGLRSVTDTWGDQVKVEIHRPEASSTA